MNKLKTAWRRLFFPPKLRWKFRIKWVWHAFFPLPPPKDKTIGELIRDELDKERFRRHIMPPDLIPKDTENGGIGLSVGTAISPFKKAGVKPSIKREAKDK